MRVFHRAKVIISLASQQQEKKDPLDGKLRIEECQISA
jgi:hypothetical protein